MSVYYWDLIEPVWEEISIYDGPEPYLAGIRSVPRHVGLLFAAHWTYVEVGNGGFSQYFANSTGIVAPEAIEAFEEIGQPRVAEILRRAVAHFGPTFPRNRAERVAKMDVSLSPTYEPDRSFDSLDDEMFGVIEEEAGGFEEAANRYAARFVERGGSEERRDR